MLVAGSHRLSGGCWFERTPRTAQASGPPGRVPGDALRARGDPSQGLTIESGRGYVHEVAGERTPHCTVQASERRRHGPIIAHSKCRPVPLRCLRRAMLRAGPLSSTARCTRRASRPSPQAASRVARPCREECVVVAICASWSHAGDKRMDLNRGGVRCVLDAESRTCSRHDRVAIAPRPVCA